MADTKKKSTTKKKPDTKKPKPTAAQKAAARKKAKGAQAFATDQLTKAGIKPKKPGKGVVAQFTAANRKAAAARAKKKLGTPKGTGAASALTAGSKKGAPRPKMTAEQFAVSQLKRGGIKPVAKGDVKAQFRKENAAVARKRKEAGLGKVAGAASALSAGMRKGVQPKKAAVKKPVVKTPVKKTAVVVKKVVAKAKKKPASGGGGSHKPI